MENGQLRHLGQTVDDLNERILSTAHLLDYDLQRSSLMMEELLTLGNTEIRENPLNPRHPRSNN